MLSNRLTALATLAAVAFPAAASATPGTKTFQQTFPHASALCTSVANGGGSARLKANKAAVASDCQNLQQSFTNAQGIVAQAVTTFKNGVASDRAQIKASCTPPVADRKACRRARRLERSDIRALRRQYRTAVLEYRRSIEAARRTFWNAIKLLPGGSSVTPDKPVAQNAPVTQPNA